MALITPRNLYSGGAVVFNSNPYVQFATNMMAKKQAKDEALDNYYRGLNKSINPKGVRTQDVPGFMQRVNGLEGFWQQNKDAIKDPRLDDGRAQTEYNSRFQDIQGYTNSSKQEELKKQPFLPLLVDPDKRDRVTSTFMNDLHSHDLPLDDPNRKSLDPASADAYFNPKSMEAADWQKYYKGVGEGITPDKNEIITTPDPNDKFSQIETTVAKYSQDKLAAIGNQAKNDYDSDHRLQYNFDKTHPFQDWKASNEPEFNKYNDIHKQVYGSDIQDDKDLHAAIVLSKKLDPTSVSKRVPDWEARDNRNFNQSVALKGIEFENAKRLAQYRKSLGLDEGGKDDGLWVDSYINNAMNNGKPAKYFDKGSNQWVTAKEVGVNPILEESLKVNGKSPDFIYALPNGEIKYGLYKVKTDDKGKPTNEFVEINGDKSVDMTNVRTATVGDVKAAVAQHTGVKHFNSEMKGGGQPQTTQSEQPTELSGKINPSTLIHGHKYKVNGEIRIWNGSKLVKP